MDGILLANARRGGLHRMRSAARSISCSRSCEHAAMAGSRTAAQVRLSAEPRRRFEQQCTPLIRPLGARFMRASARHAAPRAKERAERGPYRSVRLEIGLRWAPTSPCAPLRAFGGVSAPRRRPAARVSPRRAARGRHSPRSRAPRSSHRSRSVARRARRVGGRRAWRSRASRARPQS
jgi:hypothetical protein